MGDSSMHKRRQNLECHCSIQSVDVHVVFAKLCVPLENLTKLLGNSLRLPLSTPSYQPPNLLYIHRVRGLRCVYVWVWEGGGGGGSDKAWSERFEVCKRPGDECGMHSDKTLLMVVVCGGRLRHVRGMNRF